MDTDLRQVMQTAYDHCAPGGVALFAPDHTRATFKPDTHHGGHDQGTRGLRYLAWLRELVAVGYLPTSRAFEHSELEPGSAKVFLGLRPLNEQGNPS